MIEILFLLRKRSEGEYGSLNSSGLINSALFVINALIEKAGYQVQMQQCVDANEIDRFVNKWKPRIVIIEALWVTPEKFRELQRLHPYVKWVVRIHSNLPFFATETMGMKWCHEYLGIPNVFVAPNNNKLHRSLKMTIGYDSPQNKIIHLPNNYRSDKISTSLQPLKHDDNLLDIGCFGALRLFKNHCNQATAAVEFAEKHNFRLRFHINSTRAECDGQNVLANLRHIFTPFKGKHKLVEHQWLEHSDFKKLIATMDCCLQISLTETFNVVTADAVDMMVPVIVSKEIEWIDASCFADPSDCENIVKVMERIYLNNDTRKEIIISNNINLNNYSKNSTEKWTKFIDLLLTT